MSKKNWKVIALITLGSVGFYGPGVLGPIALTIGGLLLLEVIIHAILDFFGYER